MSAVSDFNICWKEKTMHHKSIKVNAILTLFKTIVSLILPLITFPYISRVLGVEVMGQFDFSASIVNYMLLIAGLGISTYALREGAKIRENRSKISEFASEMLLLNFLTTVVSYFLLFAALLITPKLQNYKILIYILSLQILLTLYGKSWIFTIFEEFGILTFVQIFISVLSAIAIFMFVKTPSDIDSYAIINVVSLTGSNIVYGLLVRRYVDIKLVPIARLKRHIKPIAMIFGTSIATTIYVNSDLTMLGWMINDTCVGLYSTAVKIYNIVKQVMVAVISVAIPRLTLLSGGADYKLLFNKVFNALILLVLPAATGLFFLGADAIEIFAGASYLEAKTALEWLCLALVFGILACLFGTGVLLPYMKEKKFLWSTIVSASANVILNIVLIPIYRQNAAAFTTTMSQLIAFIICYMASKPYISLKQTKRPIISVTVGCITIAGICIVIKALKLDLYVETFLCIVLSCTLYALVQLLLKNEIFLETLASVKKRLKK